MAIQAAEVASVADAEQLANLRKSESVEGGRIGLLAVTGVLPSEFTDPLIFDFTEFGIYTNLGPGYPNPYKDLDIEFMGTTTSMLFGDIDNVKGKCLATGYNHNPPEPFVVRVRILHPAGALRVGGYVWAQCDFGASVTAFDDAGVQIARYSENDCSYTPFMGVATTSARPIRYLEWRALPGASYESFPYVDHVMIDLSQDGQPPCNYKLVGDLNDDCRVDINDIALLLENWLVDCKVDPSAPGCVPK